MINMLDIIKRNKNYIFILIIVLLTLGTFIYLHKSYKATSEEQNRESALKACFKTYKSREYVSERFRDYILPVLEDMQIDTLFTMSRKDVAIMMNILLITETSRKEKDGSWYMFHSPLVGQNNLFGVKTKKGDKGNTFRTWEEVNGKKVTINDSFAVYEDYAHAIKAWFSLLQNTKLKDGTNRYKIVFEASNWAEGIIYLQNCGYMTDTKYPATAGRLYSEYLKDIYKEDKKDK